MSPRRPLGPRRLADRSGERLRAALADGSVERVRLLVPDAHARLAAVEVDGEFFAEEVLPRGYGICSYVFAWSVERDALAGYSGTYGDLRMRPDLATAVSWSGLWSVVCDVDGPTPRQVLRRQLEAWESDGFVPSVGIEHEFVLLDVQGKPLTDHGVDYALGGTERMAPILRAIRDDAREAGLGVESARAECHPGQYEIVLRHRDALAACDDAMLLQLIVRDRADVSYLAAPEPGQGNSCHVHLSLSTLDLSFVSSGSGTGLSPVMESFLAGVLRDARALTAVWAPTWNSYVRLRTAPFSPRILRWGLDDRTAAVRVTGAGGSLRLELRFAGADAQVHLVVAGLLAAGRAGVSDGLKPPPAGEVVGELCSTPWEALAELERGRLGDLLGAELAELLAASLREEIDTGLDAVTDWQRKRGALRA